MRCDHHDADLGHELLEPRSALLMKAASPMLITSSISGMSSRAGQRRECEPDDHFGRVGAERHLQEISELGELDHVLDSCVDFSRREIEIEATQPDIFHPCRV